MFYAKTLRLRCYNQMKELPQPVILLRFLHSQSHHEKCGWGLSRPPRVPDNPECLSNIVLFGVKEEGDLSGMHKVVNSQFKDMFRMGQKSRDNQEATVAAQLRSHPHPMLVKLQSV